MWTIFNCTSFFLIQHHSVTTKCCRLIKLLVNDWKSMKTVNSTLAQIRPVARPRGRSCLRRLRQGLVTTITVYDREAMVNREGRKNWRQFLTSRMIAVILILSAVHESVCVYMIWADLSVLAEKLEAIRLNGCYKSKLDVCQKCFKTS